MKLLERFILFIFSIIFIAIAVVSLLIGVEFFSESYINDIISQIYNASDIKIAVVVVSIIVIVLGLYILFSSVRTKKVESFSTKISEIGNVRISMETIENVVLNVSEKIKGVKEQKVRVRVAEDESITIVLKLIVDGITPIPELTENVQNTVKSTVEEVIGVSVNQVHVIITNVYKVNAKKSRVE